MHTAARGTQHDERSNIFCAQKHDRKRRIQRSSNSVTISIGTSHSKKSRARIRYAHFERAKNTATTGRANTWRKLDKSSLLFTRWYSLNYFSSDLSLDIREGRCTHSHKWAIIVNDNKIVTIQQQSVLRPTNSTDGGGGGKRNGEAKRSENKTKKTHMRYSQR